MRLHKICFIFIFTLCAMHTMAQKVSVDVHGGYARTGITNQTVYNKSGNGVSTGIGAAYHFTDILSAYAAVDYNLNAAQGEISYFNTAGDKLLSYNKTLQLHYVTIPVMAQFSVNYKSSVKVYVRGGMYYGFLAGAWVNPQDAGVSHSVTDDFKRNDFGLAGGLGLGYAITKRFGVNIEWHNNYGLNSTSKNVVNEYNRNNVFRLGVNYTIHK